MPPEANGAKDRSVRDAPEITTAELAGLWARLAAYLIDVLALALASWAIVFSIAGELSPSGTARVPPEAVVATVALFLVGSLVYFTVLWKQYGQTLGLRMWGIKIIRVNAAPLTWESALMRFLGYLICWATLSALFLWAVFDRRRQGLHDKMAHTYVIVVPKKKVRVTATQPYAAAERSI